MYLVDFITKANHFISPVIGHKIGPANESCFSDTLGLHPESSCRNAGVSFEVCLVLDLPLDCFTG